MDVPNTLPLVFHHVCLAAAGAAASLSHGQLVQEERSSSSFPLPIISDASLQAAVPASWGFLSVHLFASASARAQVGDWLACARCTTDYSSICTT